MPKIDLNAYQSESFFDEMFNEKKQVRSHYALFFERLKNIGWKKLNSLQHSTDRVQLSMGMTFNVYSDTQGMERILHLDIIPRIISSEDWDFCCHHLPYGWLDKVFAEDIPVQEETK